VSIFHRRIVSHRGGGHPRFELHMAVDIVVVLGIVVRLVVVQVFLEGGLVSGALCRSHCR